MKEINLITDYDELRKIFDTLTNEYNQTRHKDDTDWEPFFHKVWCLMHSSIKQLEDIKKRLVELESKKKEKIESTRIDEVQDIVDKPLRVVLNQPKVIVEKKEEIRVARQRGIDGKFIKNPRKDVKNLESSTETQKNNALMIDKKII